MFALTQHTLAKNVEVLSGGFSSTLEFRAFLSVYSENSVFNRVSTLGSHEMDL